MLATTAPISPDLLAFIAMVLIVFSLYLKRRGKRQLPPGPTPWPLVGNISAMPPAGVREWEHWLKHKDLYGPISSVSVMGRTLILLHSVELASELLEKRSAIYSSRPRMVFAAEMCGWDGMMAVSPYGPHLHAQRKHIFAVIGTKGPAARFNPLQETEVQRFLSRVLEDPEHVLRHAQTMAGAIILKITYGYNVEPHGIDPLVGLAEKANDQFAPATVPGAWIVDSIPALRHLPVWFPGLDFKAKAAEWNATLMELVDRPMQFVRRQMSKNTNTSSVVSLLIEAAGDQKEPEQEAVIKWSAASLYTAGSDTAKAQEEIDRVIGTSRLPNFEDRPHLPYVEAVVKETYRWHPVGPLALPHTTTAEDVCNGYLIPKGALVIPNIWWFTHDPAIFPDPATFDPARHLGPKPCQDPREFVFGFGRRACPGKLLGDSSVWITIASSLATFDVLKPKGPVTGELVEPEVRFTPGTISRPEPFQTVIHVRSAVHEALIKRAVDAHHWEDGHGNEI